jgi:hypothetical protein
MGLSNDFIAYGIHSLVPYRRADKLPYGIFKVLGGGTISLSAEFEDLFGGSNKYAWASEAKTISAEFTATVKSMPDFLFEVFLGATVNTTAASATGTVDGFENVKGASVLEASTGIATATVKSGSEADLKAGIVVVKAVTATTVDAYYMTDIEFSNGNDLEYIDDSLKINATPLTITASTAVEIPNTGVELTGGSGTIGMTADDTAVFKVAAAHGGISEIIIGKSSATFPEHGEVALAAKRSNGDMLEIDIHKAVGAGFPVALEETVFSIPELTVKLLYDNCKNRIATFRKIKGADSGC